MKNNIFNKLLTLILIYITLYIGLFLSLHFITPDLGTVDVTVTSNEINPELQEINISTNQVKNKYYILIYEEAEQDTWLYFNTKNYIKSSDFLVSEFIPNLKNKYILLEGDPLKSNFSFSIKSKYPLSYMANKDSKFHLFYIVSYDLFLFPTFYYSKHFVFFVDPII
ncbi:MAG: hypothetical protein RSF87_02400 [Cellulosilyticaceae bacterium]